MSTIVLYFYLFAGQPVMTTDLQKACSGDAATNVAQVTLSYLPLVYQDQHSLDVCCAKAWTLPKYLGECKDPSSMTRKNGDDWECPIHVTEQPKVEITAMKCVSAPVFKLEPVK